MTFEYKYVDYDAKNRPAGETVAEGVVKLLNANGSESWELFKYDEVGDFVRLWFKRRVFDLSDLTDIE